MARSLLLFCAVSLSLATAPGEKFQLGGFKLQSDHISGSGEVKDLSDYSDSRFYLDDDGAMVFKVCASDNRDVFGSHYPRTEIRKTSISDWGWDDGTTHTISATVKVPSIPSGKSTIIGQVHGSGALKSAYNMLLKLRYKSDGSVEARVKNSDGDELTAGDLGKVALGSELKYEIRCEDSKVHVTVNGKQVSYKPPTESKQKFYLKAGNYLQTNDGSDCVEVQMYDVSTSPSVSPSPSPSRRRSDPRRRSPSPSRRRSDPRRRSPSPSPSSWCKDGIYKVNDGVGVCCAKSCGQCGGTGCGQFPGGKGKCCADAIAKDGDNCGKPEDTGCRVPTMSQVTV